MASGSRKPTSNTHLHPSTVLPWLIVSWCLVYRNSTFPWSGVMSHTNRMFSLRKNRWMENALRKLMPGNSLDSSNISRIFYPQIHARWAPMKDRILNIDLRVVCSSAHSLPVSNRSTFNSFPYFMQLPVVKEKGSKGVQHCGGFAGEGF